MAKKKKSGYLMDNMWEASLPDVPHVVLTVDEKCYLCGKHSAEMIVFQHDEGCHERHCRRCLERMVELFLSNAVARMRTIKGADAECHLDRDDYIILADTQDGEMTITLPNGGAILDSDDDGDRSIVGKVYVIKKNGREVAHRDSV